jgi:hypothetical protein
MTQLGESVAIGLIGKAKDVECPFHDERHHDCDSACNDLKGNATTLGKALDSGKKGDSTVVRSADPDLSYNALAKKDQPDPDPDGLDIEVDVAPSIPEQSGYPVGFSAHHLIPMKESLSKAAALRKFIDKGKTLCCDLGYNVNGYENGIWLPGLHGVSSKGIGVWGAAGYDLPDNEGKGFKPRVRKSAGRKFALLHGPTPRSDVDVDAFVDHNMKWRYVQLAMKSHGARQFHDRHYDYSMLVLGHLNDVGRVLESFYGLKKAPDLPGCDKCKKARKQDASAKIPPPVGLLGLLNNTSANYRGRLLGKTSDTDYYTSSWCKKPKSSPRPTKKPRTSR